MRGGKDLEHVQPVRFYSNRTISSLVYSTISLYLCHLYCRLFFRYYRCAVGYLIVGYLIVLDYLIALGYLIDLDQDHCYHLYRFLD